MLTSEQSLILDHFKNSSDNILVNANPGTGKTYLAEQFVKENHQFKFVVISFIKEITNEISNKLSKYSNVEVKTLNSLGFKLCKDSTKGKYKFNQYIQNNPNSKSEFIVKKLMGMFEKGRSKKESAELFKKFNDVMKMVHFARFFMVSSREEIAKLAQENLSEEFSNELIQIVQQALEQINKEFDLYKWADFTDQLYQPVRNNLKLFPQYDVCIVDEAQDLNLVSLHMLKLVAKRFIFVGDKNQAILSFAGSNPNSMEDIKQHFHTTNFELTVTFRNPQSHVSFVNSIFDTNIKANKQEEGILENIDFEVMKTLLTSGDVILARSYKGSRKEHKLLSVYLQLISEGISCTCLKYDAIKEIKNYISEIALYQTSNEELSFEECIQYYFAEQMMEANSIEQEELTLLQNAFVAFYHYLNATDQASFLFKVLSLKFDESNSVKLLSIHSSKGMEYNRVFLLNASSFPYENKKMTEIQLQEEKNIYFVALTRSKSELYLVNN